LRFYLHLLSNNLNLVFQIAIGFFQFHEQLFQAEQNWLPESYCQVHEKDCINRQATDIEDLLFDFDKRDQLIIVHQHAKSKVYPTRHSQLSRLSLDQGQLNNVEDIPSNEDTD